MFGLSDQLLITLGGNILSIGIILVGGLFVLFNNIRGRTNQLFAFLMFSCMLYEVFFVVAALQTEYFAAYFWWFLNIFDVLITMSVVHFIFHIIKKERKWSWYIILTYILGIAIFAYAWLDPAAFLPTVVPKMYFFYFLEAGWWYTVMLVYFLALPLVPFVVLLVTYWNSGGVEGKRLEYIILMLLIGYAIGCLNFLLVYNIPIDPVFGMFFGFYFIPIAYGIFATNLMDIRLVLRRAVVYGITIGAVAAFLTALILLNDFIIRTLPWLGFWTVPLGVAVVSVVITRTVWAQSKDTDRLKYEFITIAAHKLRTPLTRIRWEIPGLLDRVGENKVVREGLVRIDVANNRLIELTNILMEAAHTEDTAYSYRKDPVDLAQAIKNALARFESQIKEKSISSVVQVDPSIKKMPLGDPGRVSSVVDVMIENAVVYTPQGGSIRVALGEERRGIKFSVSDTGIGVNPEDRERIFSSFFRTDRAKTADTEGVGIGLAIAKSIVEKHNGHIGVDSEGEGKGSTFWFTLPV
ncbi:MAG: ATP-binding protein [Patescibacteria group bacterium]